MDNHEAKMLLRERGVDTSFDPRTYPEIVTDLIQKGALVLGDALVVQPVDELPSE